MKNGFARFEFYLVKLEELFAGAAKEDDAGLWLYKNDARTPLFMLEGLAKLYAGMHNKKRFIKIKEDFKMLEDILGAIDYYDNIAKEFKDNPRIPITVTAYLRTVANKKIAELDKILVDEKWIGLKANKIKKIRKKLNGADWLSPKSEIKSILNFYTEAIEDIKVLALEANKGFAELESEVHELRRMLRWLSIYPKALQGLIQLNDSATEDENIKKYLTPEIVNSPFNKMPAPGDNAYFLLLEKAHFLALSWLIAELGKIKDRGLKIFALTEAMEQTEQLDNTTAMHIATELITDSEDEMQRILKEATTITTAFFDGGYLDTLVHGITGGEVREDNE